MIACNPHGKPILLTEGDFAELATNLLSDIGDINIFNFKMAVLKNLGVRSDRPNYRKWELLFSKRLMGEIQEGDFSPEYDFDPEDAQRYVGDFLEGYRYNYLNSSYTIRSLHNGTDQVICISLRDKPSLLDRVLGRYGRSYSNVNLLMSSIRRLHGTPFEFDLELDTCTYRFLPDGVREIKKG
jgi:hypothetical protein